MLVIGYGSDLRGDDAAGRRVAEAVADAAGDRVEVRSLVQLTPEVAADLVGRRLVVFVDAATDVTAVRVERIAPEVATPAATHHMNPRGLLALCGLLGGQPTQVALVSVPAHDLGLGTTLSPETEVHVARATGDVLELLADADRTPTVDVRGA